MQGHQTNWSERCCHVFPHEIHGDRKYEEHSALDTPHGYLWSQGHETQESHPSENFFDQRAHFLELKAQDIVQTIRIHREQGQR